MKTLPNTGRNPKNTRKQTPQTPRANQWLFSSKTVPNNTQNKPENTAKQQKDRKNNPKNTGGYIHHPPPQNPLRPGNRHNTLLSIT